CFSTRDLALRLEKRAEILVLVGRYVIRARLRSSRPALLHCFLGTEVVTANPSIAAQFCFGGPIHRVNPYPQFVGMCVPHQRFEPRFLLRRPLSRFRLTL